jgi:hypothetical protein
MSQMTATARPLRVPRRGPVPTPLRVLPTRIASTGSGRFATICVVLLTVGLIALLLLNTALAKGSLALGELQRESAGLADTAGNLQEEIDRASASGALAKKAAALGMVRSNERAYIDLARGTVTGTAHPATRRQAFPIVTSPTPPPAAPKQLTAAAAAVKAAAAAAIPKVTAPTPSATAPTTPTATGQPAPTATSPTATTAGSSATGSIAPTATSTPTASTPTATSTR